MAIVIKHLEPEEGSRTRARVRHGHHVFTALVDGTRDELLMLLGQECLVEMLFERVAAWRPIPDFQDEDSCIKASADLPEAIIIQGRVHSVLPIDAESSVIDLYMQTGPEFLALESSELGGVVPPVGSALEVCVHGLCFHPVHY